jgi:pimeloyl-ACP methyl ester carboxylesterase
MTAGDKPALRVGSAVSVDGTEIGYRSLGEGPGLVIVGGALSSGSNYLSLAERLTGEFEVHLMDRRGRPLSGPQGPGHSIEHECADLIAVAEATGSTEQPREIAKAILAAATRAPDKTVEIG